MPKVSGVLDGVLVCVFVWDNRLGCYDTFVCELDGISFCGSFSYTPASELDPAEFELECTFDGDLRAAYRDVEDQLLETDGRYSITESLSSFKNYLDSCCERDIEHDYQEYEDH